MLREHHLLRSLAERSVPVVTAFGTVVERVDDAGDVLGGLLITRHLQFSQPYRALFTGRSVPGLRSQLLDALAALFVQLHLAGFWDLDAALVNIAGELYDLQSGGVLDPRVDVAETARALQPRYDALWDELTGDFLVPFGETFRINA